MKSHVEVSVGVHYRLLRTEWLLKSWKNGTCGGKQYCTMAGKQLIFDELEAEPNVVVSE